MNPDEITTTAQTGQQTPRPRGDSMPWRRFIIIVLIAMFVAMFFTLFVALMLFHGTGGNRHFLIQILIEIAILAIAMTSYFIGIEKLKRSGYLKVKRTLEVMYFIAFIFFCFPNFPRNKPLQNPTDLKIALIYHSIPFLVLLLSTLPLSLYLTRNQNKSTSQPTSDYAG
jgi:hypothetical protein